MLLSFKTKHSRTNMQKQIYRIFFLLTFSVSLSFISLEAVSENVNTDLIELLNHASETSDIKIINDVINAILEKECNSSNILNALSDYSENGKVDFALHNAIKDKNITSSLILAYYSKDVNTKKVDEKVCWTTNYFYFRESKSPLELSLAHNIKGLIPYLLIIKKADPYKMRDNAFIIDGEEPTDYCTTFFGHKLQEITCINSKRKFYHSPKYKRSFIGDAIVWNQLGVLAMLKQAKVDLNRICAEGFGKSYTPLQFSLATGRYEIAQFLIDSGVKIE